jgi:hypothetical protein
MKSPVSTLKTLLVITLATSCSLAQRSTVEDVALNVTAAPFSSDNSATSAAFVTAPPHPKVAIGSYRPFSALGFATRLGVGRAGFDFATPLAKKLNLRAGADLFQL